MKSKFIFAALAAVAIAVTGGYATAQGPAGITIKNVLRDDLKGLTNQETIMQYLDIAPNAVVPWHTHPDGHEISFVVEGELTLEEDGKGKRKVSTGEGFHIQPGSPHTAVNTGSTTAKVLVVRLNEKGKAVAVPWPKK
ncbi:MAG: cupin domain-containing protein [Xanthobacteraceae bacterium]|jgi:quercetin dioxygenase-like cupin family protein